ncbi:MAG: UMF1 family MFS transporter [Saprospiraceae bacterium]|jgi:UMF1 family MFS transporter
MSNKSIQRGWVVFDWANSAYSLVIVSTVFPAIFNSFAGENPVFLGINFYSADALYTYSICFSFLVIAILSPILSGIADYSGQKKRFMQFFTILGSFSCVALYFFSPDNLWLGVLGAILASIGYSGSMVFYNAFLPEIASKKEQDALSAKGYSYGYIGSSLLLITLLIMVANYDVLGFSSKLQVFKVGFVLVGLWWFGWAQWTFKVLPNKSKVKLTEVSKFKEGFKELKFVWKELNALPVLGKFLKAFFMTSLGLQTLIIVAPLFALNVVGMAGSDLIVVVLIMQLLGVIGAVFFSKLSKSKGNVLSLMTATAVYLIICITAFLYADKTLFYIQAGFMGFALGGIQSQARSAYAKLLPGGTHTASYFSFYDVLEKIAIVLGTFIYAGVIYYFSSLQVISASRIGILILGVFFMIGLFLWLPLKKEPKLKPGFELE